MIEYNYRHIERKISSGHRQVLFSIFASLILDTFRNLNGIDAVFDQVLECSNLNIYDDGSCATYCSPQRSSFDGVSRSCLCGDFNTVLVCSSLQGHADGSQVIEFEEPYIFPSHHEFVDQMIRWFGEHCRPAMETHLSLEVHRCLKNDHVFASPEELTTLESEKTGNSSDSYEMPNTTPLPIQVQCELDKCTSLSLEAFNAIKERPGTKFELL